MVLVLCWCVILLHDIALLRIFTFISMSKGWNKNLIFCRKFSVFPTCGENTSGVSDWLKMRPDKINLRLVKLGKSTVLMLKSPRCILASFGGNWSSLNYTDFIFKSARYLGSSLAISDLAHIPEFNETGEQISGIF